MLLLFLRASRTLKQTAVGIGAFREVQISSLSGGGGAVDNSTCFWSAAASVCLSHGHYFWPPLSISPVHESHRATARFSKGQYFASYCVRDYARLVLLCPRSIDFESDDVCCIDFCTFVQLNRGVWEQKNIFTFFKAQTFWCVST